MFHLALTLWILAVPTAGTLGTESPAVAELSRDELCAAARRIAADGACLRPEDCPGLQEWKRLFGAPRAEPLDPSLAQGFGNRPRISPPRLSLACETTAVAALRPHR